MEIGKVRPARLGEVPGFYALEEIHEGQGVVIMPEEPKVVEHHHVEFVLRMGHSDFYRERLAEKRRKRFVRWVWAIAAVVLLGSLFYASFVRAASIEYAAADHIAEPGKMVQAVVTAYTSSVDETDDTPFITASGSHTRPGVVACPAKYAFGQEVEIAGEVYVCEDRMNARYRETERFDVWVESKDEAYAWGKQELAVVIR